jgi:hypothetical protein
MIDIEVQMRWIEMTHKNGVDVEYVNMELVTMIVTKINKNKRDVKVVFHTASGSTAWQLSVEHWIKTWKVFMGREWPREEPTPGGTG